MNALQQALIGAGLASQNQAKSPLELLAKELSVLEAEFDLSADAGDKLLAHFEKMMFVRATTEAERMSCLKRAKEFYLEKLASFKK